MQPPVSSSIPFGRMPDPRRVHGAWIYLFAAVGAGALLGAEGALVPALLAGTTFAGLFLIASVLAIGRERGKQPLIAGTTLAVLAPTLSIMMGGDPGFLWLVGAAIPPAVLSLVLALGSGWLAPSALACGVFTLILAAPSAARAGGASWSAAAWLFVLLLIFFEWRTLRIAFALRPGSKIDGLNAQTMRAQGLREAALTLVWTAGTVLVLA